jgi:hypothetical protein
LLAYKNYMSHPPVPKQVVDANGSVLSLIALLGGIGILFAVFGRWGGRLGWHGREQATLS